MKDDYYPDYDEKQQRDFEHRVRILKEHKNCSSCQKIKILPSEYYPNGGIQIIPCKSCDEKLNALAHY